MPRGGPRSNAGRKKGGAAKIDKKARAQAMESGISPLDFLLNVMRGEAYEFSSRLDAAKAAAPYVHSKLSSVDATVKGEMGLTVEIIKRVYE